MDVFESLESEGRCRLCPLRIRRECRCNSLSVAPSARPGNITTLNHLFHGNVFIVRGGNNEIRGVKNRKSGLESGLWKCGSGDEEQRVLGMIFPEFSKWEEKLKKKKQEVVNTNLHRNWNRQDSLSCSRKRITVWLISGQLSTKNLPIENLTDLYVDILVKN